MGESYKKLPLDQPQRIIENIDNLKENNINNNSLDSIERNKN